MAGNIEKKGPNRWLIRIDFGIEPTGKRRRHSEIFHGPKKYAERRKTELLAGKNKGSFTWSTRETLDLWLDNWLETAVKSKRAKTTYQSYKQIAKDHIRPAFGSKLLSDLTHASIQAHIDKMTLNGLSARTARYAFAVLRMALRDAVRANKIGVNPCNDVELPKLKRANETVKAMTREQAKAFITASYSEPRGLVYRLALETGCRMEETLGLQWPDLDLNAGKLTIRRALVYSREKGESWFFQPTKTKSGDRTITLSPGLVNELKEHRKEQLQMMMLVGSEYDRELDLVFANEFGGFLDQGNLSRRTFKRILTAARLNDKGFTPHCLRHTAATLQLENAANPHVVSERLGHSSVKFTLDRYDWTRPEQEEQAAAEYAQNCMDKAFPSRSVHHISTKGKRQV